MTESVIRVSRTYSKKRIGQTKGRQRRRVYLDPKAVKLLGAWWGESGKPGDDALVFPAETGGYLEDWRFTKDILYPAMKRAGIARVLPDGRKRDVHAIRKTYGRIVLESGRSMYWLSLQLGHSSVDVTEKSYSEYGEEARQKEAKGMEAAFSF